MPAPIHTPPIHTPPDQDRIASSLASAAAMLAARIVNGATLWCVAPGMDDHARHLAVEFVHPSSVGARSVPAIAVATSTEDALVEVLRSSARSGDVLVTMGDADAPLVDELCLRTQAWGVSHLHLGWSSGTQLAMVASWSVIVGANDSAERFLTRTYHLLWELTFVCLRHVRPAPPGASCAVCADEATLAEVESTLDAQRVSARTACGSVILDVSLIEPTRPHDLVLAHAGTALRRVPLAPLAP